VSDVRGWLPGRWVTKIPAPVTEPMTRNHPRRGLTLHNEGVDRECTKGHVANLAHYVNHKRINYHFVWCPTCGDWAQLAPLDKAARSMVGGPVWKGASANKAGTINVQVCVAGFGYRDFTDRPRLRRAWVLAEIMDEARIPWKARATWGGDAGRGIDAWMRGGIQGHQHGPSDDHTDPGPINIERLVKVARLQQKARRRK
jgi:hypothetical protein